MMKNKILTILPLIGHPRHSKRIAMLQKYKYLINIMSFKRDYHTGRLPNCEINYLGNIDHGKYFKRLIKLLFCIPKIRSEIKKHNLVYCAGHDLAYLAILANIGINKPIILEVGDLTAIQISDSIIGKLVRFFDKILLKKCTLLIVTSQSFYDKYYKNWLKSNIKYLLIENKLEKNFTDKCKPSGMVNSKKIKIGYFGVLRSQWSWNVLKSLAVKYPKKFEIIFAGIVDLPINLESEIKNIKNITFFGEYKSVDLPKLYNEIDMIWGCNPPTKLTKWALPNRFYEGCFFKKPIFCRKDTEVERLVDKYGIGMVVSDNKVNTVIDNISKLKKSEINNWINNINNLKNSVYIYTDEGEKLNFEIKNILK